MAITQGQVVKLKIKGESSHRDVFAYMGKDIVTPDTLCFISLDKDYLVVELKSEDIMGVEIFDSVHFLKISEELGLGTLDGLEKIKMFLQNRQNHLKDPENYRNLQFYSNMDFFKWLTPAEFAKYYVSRDSYPDGDIFLELKKKGFGQTELDKFYGISDIIASCLRRLDIENDGVLEEFTNFINVALIKDKKGKPLSSQEVTYIWRIYQLMTEGLDYRLFPRAIIPAGLMKTIEKNKYQISKNIEVTVAILNSNLDVITKNQLIQKLGDVLCYLDVNKTVQWIGSSTEIDFDMLHEIKNNWLGWQTKEYLGELTIEAVHKAINARKVAADKKAEMEAQKELENKPDIDSLFN